MLISFSENFRFTSTFLWRRQWQPTPVLLPGKSHGWRSLVGCNPWGGTESDTTERLHFHFSLSCIREGNGNPLQCSCLENPKDGGAWWAAVYGVAQSRTRLKRLSSSSSSCLPHNRPIIKRWGAETRNSDFIWKARRLKRWWTSVLEYHLTRVWIFYRTEKGRRWGGKVKWSWVLQNMSWLGQHWGQDVLNGDVLIPSFL